MSQASNWWDLYKFEDAVENAVVAILEAASLTAVRSLGSTSFTTPRCEVQFTVAGNGADNLEHYGVRPADSTIYPAAWRGTLLVGVVTTRSKSQDHATIRGKVRWLMQDLAQFTEARMPYHQPVRIIETGTSVSADNDADQDESAVTFDMVVGIRADAWPAP